MAKVIELQQDSEQYKRYMKDLSKTVNRLLKDVVSNLCLRVNEFLPKGWFFGIQLEDGNKQVFRVGLQDDDRLRSALSGAEWATVTSALSMVLAESLPQKEPRIIIPEDRAWDAKTLSNVMRGFDNFDGQVIIASTIRPKGRPPKNWTIIDMDQWLEEQVESQAEEADEAVEEEVPPASDRAVSSQGAAILQGLGFTGEQILRMSPESAAEIIKQGWTIKQVAFDMDGNVFCRGA